MSKYAGDIHLGDTIDVKFTSIAAATGAPTTLSGSPSVAAYVGNSTTEITAGITLSVDFDARTGLNNVRVVASSGNGYAAATNISLVITAGTVGGTSVAGYEIGSFSIDCRGVNQVLGTAVTAASAGILDVNAKNLGGTAQTGRDIGASVLLSAGTGTGQLDFTSGVVKANLVQILATALTETAGQLAGGFKKFFNIASPASTMDHLTLIDTVTTATTATNLTNAPTAGDFTATMKTSIGTAVAASAVASVTGNVGGNVTGSVGSVASGGITRASLAADTGLQPIRSNTAQAGAATTITLDAGASATNSFYNNCLILLTGGTGVGQARFISGYVGATKVATVATWATNPDNTTTFALLPFDAIAGASAPTVAQIVTGIFQDLTSSSDFTTSGSIGKLFVDNINATISSRMATYTQPTGFLAATFPTTVASPTNITAASGVALTSAYDAAKTAAQAGDVMKVSSGTGANQLNLSAGVVASDLKKINGTTVNGDGSTTPWAP